MKTGVSMGSVIDTKKLKKYRKMTQCNCSRCVNKEKDGCRFGWEPIKGKCNRFGTNHYKLTNEEKKEAKQITQANKEKMRLEKEKSEKIFKTSLCKLDEALETKLNLDILRQTTKYKNFGNGRFSIKFIGNENEDIISVRFRNKKYRKYKIIK